MVAIVMHRRITKAAPNPWTKEKLLKSCRCCRANKTVCDALQTSPLPCTFCTKRNLACHIDAAKPVNRDYDHAGEVLRLVEGLQRQLYLVVSRKEELLKKLVDKKILAQQAALIAQKEPAPSVADIQDALFSPEPESDDKLFIDPIPTRVHTDSFTIHSNLMSLPLTISRDRAETLFEKFREEFCDYLPVLPDSFFRLDLHDIHKESDLLFWTIIVTAYISHGLTEDYSLLSAHVQNLVVVNCWFKTPRSLYSLVALLILTSWPLPNRTSHNIQTNIAIKYASLMKSLALQFGLHKLKFIREFSKKTNVDIDARSDINNIIRERIYKYVNINSNFWLVYLGLSNSNYNGFSQDYIIDKAANFDLFKKDEISARDDFINSLLKISLIQLKMNESMGDFLTNPHKVGKLIHLNMYEQILNGYMGPSSPLYSHDLISLSLEFTKLQLYVYYLSESDIELKEYQKVIARTIMCCQAIIEIFEKRFGDKKKYQLIPIHYRFSIELATLVTLQIHSSPLLTTLQAYTNTKKLFLRAYNLIQCDDHNLMTSTKVLLMCVEKVDKCNKILFWAQKSRTNNFFLVDKMAKYLVSASYYEMLWQVYECERLGVVDDDVDWSVFGLDSTKPEAQKIIAYIKESPSILA
ncbi:hypothetical protein PUMCH_004900 [Australozyma saopauloensis]|uniref:Zn(2)-C6 fungal-type domain-containing protein n=1 Tax=Australozyma saopauloensis TaxID=291208 RepID=A0AAX4HFW8_9ASCO|nr:hypothetical protein PUMCH_004900 [[Candida] saopauloensis]